VRPTREVIVQRVEPPGRGDEWSDPWMRSKSPGLGIPTRERHEKRRRDRRSYSSNSSYSTSNSSQSGSSSDSSRSSSPENTRRRYVKGSHGSPTALRKHGVRLARSPSPLQRRGRHSPGAHIATLTKKRHQSSTSPLSKRRLVSPGHKRKKMSPFHKKSYLEKSKLKRMKSSSSSGSGSTSSSSSDSDSDSVSSTSDSSSRGRSPPKRSRAVDKHLHERRALKSEMTKKRSPISIEIKKQATVGASALLSPTHSVSSEKESKKTRREELLKQLRAVEDAIAKKRSKLS